ncbi:hypothetical protein BH11PSE10_BH11PSE10_10250 [soil metagenome]
MKAKEVSQVVAKIQVAIEHYNLTADMLFGAKVAAKKRVARADAKAVKKPVAKKIAAAAKYQDGAGHTWSGHGKRPNWFKDAIAGGMSADDLLIQRASLTN